MLLVDTALRMSAITMLLLTAVLVLRDARHLLQGKIAVALCISLSGMLINTMPLVMGLPASVHAAAWYLHMPNTVLLWMFGLSLYQDDFKLSRVHWAAFFGIIAALLFMVYSARLGWRTANIAGQIVNRAIGLGTLVHLLWVAISGWSDDLVESRRRTRLWFVIGIAITAILVITGETAHYIVSGGSHDPDWLSTLRTAVIWPMIAFGTFWFVSVKPEGFLFETTVPAEPNLPKINPKDAVTHRKLVECMEDGAFKEAGLTIGALAEKIAVPEHQLRALINRGLGFRNFSAFLNSYRLGYAKEVLSDPEQARLPVLTVAMDAGYNSLAPFNRAFKAAEDVTPTEFRRLALAKTDQS